MAVVSGQALGVASLSGQAPGPMVVDGGACATFNFQPHQPPHWKTSAASCGQAPSHPPQELRPNVSTHPPSSISSAAALTLLPMPRPACGPANVSPARGAPSSPLDPSSSEEPRGERLACRVRWQQAAEGLLQGR